jgi:hypothetical protein
MSKKNLQSVAASLSGLAATMPSQKPPALTVVPAPAAAGEPLVQFSFSMRRSLRRELDRLAADADQTMRSFVLEALKAKGLSVTDEDLLDLRKAASRPGKTSKQDAPRFIGP